MLNVIVLNGRLTADPELRHTSTDVAVSTFTLAVDRTRSAASGERVTDFFNIVTWRTTAEFVSRYFSKGMLVAVQGTLQTRDYTDRDGNKRRSYDIVADNVHFAEAKRDNASSGERSQGNSQRSTAPSGAPAYSNADSDSFSSIDIGDDDLPF